MLPTSVRSQSCEDKIKVMQAFISGEEIQARLRSEAHWTPATTPLWDWCKFEYRVPKEPRKIVVCFNRAGAFLWASLNTQLLPPHGDSVVVEFIEVMK